MDLSSIWHSLCFSSAIAIFSPSSFCLSRVIWSNCDVSILSWLLPIYWGVVVAYTYGTDCLPVGFLVARSISSQDSCSSWSIVMSILVVVFMLSI